MYLCHKIVFIYNSSFYLLFLVLVIETVCMIVINYINYIGCLLNTLLDEIEFWCHWPVDFRGSWILNTPESIIVCFLLQLRFVCLNPISKAHIAVLVIFPPSFDIMVLSESYEALLINIMTRFLSSTLSNCFFKLVMWTGFTSALIISTQSPKFAV